MELRNVKVSILVPVYKVPEMYLRKCIESLVGQTLKEIQIILVDDGSPDHCGDICDEYAQKDSRIIVIHQNNRGLSGARNSAYDAATGEYIMFLDGDDYVVNVACEEAYKTAEAQKVEIVLWDIITDYSNSKKLNKTFEGTSRYFDRSGCKELQERVLNFNGKIAQVFAKLIRKDLLDRYDIRHIESLKQGAEGLVFNINLFEHASSAYYLDIALNHYVYNEKSISHSHNEENYYLIVRCFEYIEEYIQNSDNMDNLTKRLYERLLYVVVTTGITGYFNPDNHETYTTKVKGYKKFLAEPIIDRSLKEADRSALSMQRKIILKFVDWQFFFPIFILGYVRRMQLGNR